MAAVTQKSGALYDDYPSDRESQTPSSTNEESNLRFSITRKVLLMLIYYY